nr:B3 domain-containing protein Os01g0234100-like isoform X2 [Lolium perenne]
MESGPIKCPGGRFKKKAQRTTAYKRKKMWPEASKSAKSDKDDNLVPRRKRGRPAGSKSAKSNLGRKPTLAYINSTDSEGERDKDDDFDLMRKRRCPAVSKFAKNNKDDNFVPTKKKGRPAGSKSAKRKMGLKPASTHICSSNSKGERDKGNDFDPTVPHADGRKKNAWVQGRYGSAFKRASEAEAQEKFPGEYPRFTKCMMPSNVLRVFWLHLSSDFCRSYLPQCNTKMILEDEDGQTDYVKYLSARDGLSGGWRGFAIDHSLKVGDTVVFELVEPTKFKVYIRREDKFTTADDDARSKEDLAVATRDSSTAPSDDANIAGEQAVGDVGDGIGSPDSGIKDPDGITAQSSTDQVPVEREGYVEVKLEKDDVAEKMKALKSMMAALKEGLKAVDIEVEELESSVEKNAQAMQQMLNAQ